MCLPIRDSGVTPNHRSYARLANRQRCVESQYATIAGSLLTSARINSPCSLPCSTVLFTLSSPMSFEPERHRRDRGSFRTTEADRAGSDDPPSEGSATTLRSEVG